MGFVFDGLEAEAYDRTYSDRQLARRIVGYFRPELGQMLLVALMIVLGSLANAAFPVVIAQGVGAAQGGIPVRTVVLIVIAILLSGALAWVFNFVRQSYSARAVGEVVLRLRQDAFDAVLARDLSFYDEFPSGKIVSRVTSDTEDFSTVVTLVLNLISQVLLVVIVAAVLFHVDVRLALLALATTPVIVLVALAFRRMARTTTRHAQRARGNVNALIQETISGISIAKNFRQERVVYDQFTGVNRQSYAVNLRQGLLFTAIFPILYLIAGMGTVIVVYFGGRGILAGNINAGAWYLFVQAVGLFWFPLTSIASFWSQFQQGLAASERVFALIDAEARVQQRAEEPVTHLRGRIEFRALDFAYTEQQRVLHDFNLLIPAGQSVAIVGHTGAGKTTLGKLISRFYEFQGGDLLIDGRDIRTLDLAQYRRQLGVVPQLPFLFSGTVADNIRYARPEASDAEVEAVARRIAGGEWLEALPSGLATEVGEEGRGLSMGQRQLVAIARVLLQDPGILILDEATASVDPLTEELIQEGLDEALKGRTSIVIAHRLSTITAVDRILVLDHGQVVEEGTHAGLLAKGGRYAQLYNTYFRHQSPDYRPGEGFVTVHEEVAG